jgi:hypothetical protein
MSYLAAASRPNSVFFQVEAKQFEFVFIPLWFFPRRRAS